jgi:hypothetical protein
MTWNTGEKKGDCIASPALCTYYCLPKGTVIFFCSFYNNPFK